MTLRAGYVPLSYCILAVLSESILKDIKVCLCVYSNGQRPKLAGCTAAAGDQMSLPPPPLHTCLVTLCCSHRVFGCCNISAEDVFSNPPSNRAKQWFLQIQEDKHEKYSGIKQNSLIISSFILSFCFRVKRVHPCINICNFTFKMGAGLHT